MIIDRPKYVSFSAVFLALGFANPGFAATQSFAPVADATVQSVSPSSNYGSAATLETDGDGSDTTKESFLKFAVTGIGGAVTSAIVRLYVTDGSVDGPGIYAVSDDSWSESGITWEDMPAHQTKLQGKGAMTAGTFVDFDVTSAVTADGTYSFRIAAAGADGAKVSSRNASSNRPQLLISTADSAPSAFLVTSGTTFANRSFDLQTAPFEIDFTATPSASNMNGVAGVSSAAADGYDDLVANVRFNPAGAIDARNAGGYGADASVSYGAKLAYRFRLVIDPTRHRYDAYVTPPGEAEIRLGASYDFRTDQATASKLNHLTARAEVGGIAVTNVVLKPGTGPAPSPTPSPSPTSTSSPTPPPSGNPLSQAVFTSLGSSDATIDGVSYGNQSAAKSYSIMKSQHGGIFRFELHQGENRTGKDPADRDRCELQQEVTYAKGTDLWASYSFMLEKGADFNTGGDSSFDNVFTQWHAGTGSPPLSIRIFKSNTLFVKRINDVDDYKAYETTAFKRGTWYNVVQHVVFSSSGNGVIQIWINENGVAPSGAPVLNLTKLNTTYSKSSENYFKFGIYRDTVSQVEVAYYANMEAGSKNLLDRVAHPLPIAP